MMIVCIQAEPIFIRGVDIPSKEEGRALLVSLISNICCYLSEVVLIHQYPISKYAGAYLGCFCKQIWNTKAYCPTGQ